MKKTYIIPEACIADCENAILLTRSLTPAKSQNATYTVGDETQEYESDGY